MAENQARFIGELDPKWLPDGRLMQLKEDFTFIDGNGLSWTAPSGTIVDGASIPRILWPIFGGPFEGLYRDASVVHDYYCDKKTRSWQSVHRMFHEACLTEGLDVATAKVMYAGVYAGGPRWTVGIGSHSKSLTGSESDIDSLKIYEYSLTPADDFVETNKQWIEKENPSLDEIEHSVNAQYPTLMNLAVHSIEM